MTSPREGVGTCAKIYGALTLGPGLVHRNFWQPKKLKKIKRKKIVKKKIKRFFFLFIFFLFFYVRKNAVHKVSFQT
jgi:dolichyl-phosphate-mannose--protein O-mannosyl transferase